MKRTKEQERLFAANALKNIIAEKNIKTLCISSSKSLSAGDLASVDAVVENLSAIGLDINFCKDINDAPKQGKINVYYAPDIIEKFEVLSFAKQSDGIVLFERYTHTSRKSFDELCHLCEQNHIDILGIIAIK